MSLVANNVREFTEADNSLIVVRTRERGFCPEEDIESLGGTIGDISVPIFVLRAGQGEPRFHLPDSKMPGVRCPRCAEQGIEQFVLSGKRCPQCNHQC